MSSEIESELLEIQRMSAVLYCDQADALLDASLYLSRGVDIGNEHGKAHIISINALFGIELYIKAILLYCGITPPKTHSIQVLWRLLPESLQQEISDTWSQAISQQEQDRIKTFTSEYTIIRYNEGCIGDPKALIHALSGLKKVYEVRNTEQTG